MRFNENDTVRLNFFFRVTSIRGCPTFRGVTLSRVAVLSVFRENERANFCREITLHAFLTSRGKAYIYLYFFFPRERRDNIYTGSLLVRHFISAPDDWNFFIFPALSRETIFHR